jgi:alkanesulfonate monooxygenase SsuD/methylene tetrahydromethanopterin reductase-like flavin-dependent oxidoreductase (luciferase family)
MVGRWQPHEQQAVGDFLGLAVIGGPEKVRARLEVLLEQSGADELIFTCDLYQPEHRLRSFEIVAGLR